MSTLDPRDPLVVDVRGLARRAGAMMLVERSAPAPADLGSGLAHVPLAGAMDLRLRCEAVIEGVLVSGTVTATVQAECARCLDPISWDETFGLTELYLHEPGPPDEDLPLLAGDLLDLQPTLRDAIVLALPLAPLCQPECPGLCSECGARLVDDPEHHHDTIDPRWARLAAVRND